MATKQLNAEPDEPPERIVTPPDLVIDRFPAPRSRESGPSESGFKVSLQKSISYVTHFLQEASLRWQESPLIGVHLKAMVLFRESVSQVPEQVVPRKALRTFNQKSFWEDFVNFRR